MYIFDAINLAYYMSVMSVVSVVMLMSMSVQLANGHIITLNEYLKGHKFLGWLSCSVFSTMTLSE